jgi:Tol biopolymer transport system component
MNQTETPLESWKEIGAYLQRDATTARRWEKEEGLPVHRHSHKSRSSVYAYPSEIDAWRRNRRVVVDPPPVNPWYRPLAIGLTTLACLILVSSGRPASAAGQPGKQSARQVWTGPEVDYSGTVGADGRYLSFTDWSTGDLAVRDLRTGKSQRLTDTGGWEKSGGDYAYSSVISPDGTEVAYSWWVYREWHADLRVVSLKGAMKGGKEPRSLIRGTSDEIYPIGWIPGSRQLLVGRILRPDLNNQIGTISLADGSYRTLKSAARFIRPTLSIDGRWVAYGLLPDPEHHVEAGVYVLNTETAQETLAVSHDNRPLTWSLDGSRVYFLSDRAGSFSMWGVGIASGKATGAPELIRQDTGLIDSMGMARGGAFYYLVRGADRSNIYSADIAAGGAIGKPVLAAENPINSNAGASISPDGKWLAYYVVRNGQDHKVVVRSLETGKEREFVQPLNQGGLQLHTPSLSGPMWLPDGESLIITTRESPKPGTQFVRLDVTSGKKELILSLTKPALSFKLSPDGRVLYYIGVTESGTTAHLMRYDLESRHGTELNAVRVLQPEIAISPDGKQLAYAVEVEPSTVRYIAVMPAAGGSSNEIFRGKYLVTFNSLEWSPDGKFLLFGKGAESPNAPRSLWRVPAVGGAPEPTGLSQPGVIRGPQTQPDGKRLFYTVSEPNANELWVLENFLPQTASRR